jgi:phosphatidylserine/phosphatidylglycerophosphate/cardiolipin synthase-like enzyme
VLLACLLVIGPWPLASPAVIAQSKQPTCPTVQACFNPGGYCAALILKEIGAARQSILVQAYSFTNHDIAEALAKAKHRGLRVEVILDRRQTAADGQRSAAGVLFLAGVSVLMDSGHSIAHNKIMVIDDGVVITGSFNFTEAAERRNAENVLIVRDKETARRYSENWESHKQHSN